MSLILIRQFIQRFFKVILVLVSLFFIGVVSAVAILFYFSSDLPKIESLADYNPPLPTKIYAKSGELLLEVGPEKRDIVQVKDVPQKIIDCFTSAEDDNFFEHDGVDYLGLIRAALANLKAGKVVQGGSTITQQVAKSLLLTNERSFSRKIKDFLLAQKIEKKLTKNEILFLYLNQMYFGGGFYGIKEAFRGYFGKELSEVTPAECALVAGLLVAPGKYSPYVNPQFAKTRQKYVLNRLNSNDKISSEEYENALNEDIKVFTRENLKLKAPYFTDWILQVLFDYFGKEKILSGGYEINTSLDYELNEVAQNELMKGLRDIDKRQGYKGATKNLAADDYFKFAFESYKKFQKELYTFATFTKEGKLLYPGKIDEDKFKRLIKQQPYFSDHSEKSDDSDESDESKDSDNEVKKKYLGKLKILNIKNNQELLSHLPKNEILNQVVQAVVLEVSDSAKLIYVLVGPFIGVIPLEYFKWAHKRSVHNETIVYGEEHNPLKIVKVGDVIDVIIRSTDGKISSFIPKVHKDELKKNPETKNIDENNFLVASLEQFPEVEGAVISLDVQTGNILTMVGGKDFNLSKFNRTIQSKRQPGSSVKAFIYGSALENGYHPASILYDTPQSLVGVDDFLSWKPKNYDGEFLGEVTFRKSLETSRNIPTIKLVQDIGVDKVISYMKRFGFTTDLPKDLSLSLGSFGVSPLELTKAYAIFPNQGQALDAKAILSIKDSAGNDVELPQIDVLKANVQFDQKTNANSPVTETTNPTNTPTEVSENGDKSENNVNEFMESLNGYYVFDRRLAYLMNNVLKGVIIRGTGSAAHDLSPNIAGKTGTTNNYIDAWFVGYNPKVITAVWTGFDDNRTMGYSETGGKAALPIWKEVMRKAISIYGDAEFSIPGGITFLSVSKENGSVSKAKNENAILEAFAEGHTPGARNSSGPKAENIKDRILESGDDYYLNQ